MAWKTMLSWFGVLPRSPRSPRAQSGDDGVAREAIRMLREAALDFHRAGHPTFSHLYTTRAASLERRLAHPSP